MSTYNQRIKNHTRITVTAKKTGETYVVLETKDASPDFKVGGVDAGIPITECVDETLDSLTFCIHASPTKELFKPFEVIHFTIDDGIKPVTYEMVTLFDHSQLLSRLNKTYRHTVAAIESVKLLEKIKIFNLNLTNPHDTLLRQCKKALINAEPIVSTRDRLTEQEIKARCRFQISPKLEALLSNIPGEDFRFGNTDLRTVLDGILAVVNSCVQVDGIAFENNDIAKITLGYKSLTQVTKFNPIWTAEEQGEIVNDELQNNGQDFAGKIVARGYNTLMKEPLTVTDTFKSDSSSVNESNAYAFLSFPISSAGLRNFKIKVNLYGSITVQAAGHSAIATAYLYGLWVDIAENLVPNEQYELLSESDRKDKIPYQIGSNIIGTGKSTNEIFNWTKSTIKNILFTNVKKQYGEAELAKMLEATNSYAVTGSGSLTDIYGDYYNFPFSISYYPSLDTVAEITKPGVYEKDDILLGIMDSQTENTLDVQRHGKRLESLIKRTGNDEGFIDVNAKHFSKLLPLMAKIDLPADESGYTDTDYVVYKRECAVYDNYLKCRYYLSKNFNMIQKVAGVNREKHLYDIPLESDECPIIIKKYLVFSLEANDGTVRDFSSYVVQSALGTLFEENKGREYTYTEEDETEKTDITDGKIKYFLFNSSVPLEDENAEILPDTTHFFMLPCLGYGQAKTMNFIARPLDNYSVGYGRGEYVFSIFGDKGWQITYNRYVSDRGITAGECSSFKLNLAFDCKALLHPKNSFSYNETVKNFPVVQADDFVVANTSDLQVEYLKDSTQKPLFCFSFECLPSSDNFQRIFIGSAFCRDNNLVKDNGEGLEGLRLVVSYKQTLNGASDYIVDDYVDFESRVSEYFNLKDNVIEYKNNFPNKNVQSWAIVNESGEIYIAVNSNFSSIYVYLSEFTE